MIFYLLYAGLFLPHGFRVFLALLKIQITLPVLNSPCNGGCFFKYNKNLPLNSPTDDGYKRGEFPCYRTCTCLFFEMHLLIVFHKVLCYVKLSVKWLHECVCTFWVIHVL